MLQHPLFFIIIRDKELPITTNVLYRVLSPYEHVEKIARFQIMHDFHAQINFSQWDAINAFCMLQLLMGM